MTPEPSSPAPLSTVDEPASPLPRSGRVPSLDVLRGVAILGILAMNIRNYGLSLRDFDNPAINSAAESSTPAATDLWTWATANILFEDKMIALLSLLFGAGIVIFADRAAARGSATLLHLRRMLWLFVIGLAHAYLLWYGDILNTYAVCGVVIWPLRKLHAGTLIGVGVIVLLVAVWWRQGPPIVDSLQRPAAVAAPERPLTAARQIIRRAVQTEEGAHRGAPATEQAPARPPSYSGLFRWRADLNTFWHYHGVISFNFWRCAGYMLVGMGLVRLRVLSAALSARAYLGMLLAGYGLGLTFTLLGFYPSFAEALGRGVQTTGEPTRLVGWLAWPARYLGAAGVALGHAALCLLLCKAARRGAWLTPLSACGRMALTNYLMQTAICILIFDGWAGGQWNRWSMSQLYVLVASIWAVQLLLSPLWLSMFRFGPAEWAWRSLTYWRLQPMRASGPG